jgi:hypothetical protein
VTIGPRGMASVGLRKAPEASIEVLDVYRLPARIRDRSKSAFRRISGSSSNHALIRDGDGRNTPLFVSSRCPDAWLIALYLMLSRQPGSRLSLVVNRRSVVDDDDEATLVGYTTRPGPSSYWMDSKNSRERPSLSTCIAWQVQALWRRSVSV